MFSAGVQSSDLNLMYESDSRSSISVKTPFGATDRTDVLKTIAQGECMSSLKCTASVDTIAKEANETVDEHLYKYRKSITIPPLQMVDDQLAIAPCGLDAVITNSFMNAQTNLKRMQYGAHKCFRLHIGKNCNLCSDLNVDTWGTLGQCDGRLHPQVGLGPEGRDGTAARAGDC